VNLIRNAKLDAKIDARVGKVTYLSPYKSSKTTTSIINVYYFMCDCKLMSLGPCDKTKSLAFFFRLRMLTRREQCSRSPLRGFKCYGSIMIFSSVDLFLLYMCLSKDHQFYVAHLIITSQCCCFGNDCGFSLITL